MPSEKPELDKVDDGGQAFPRPLCDGMTLRDYFASQAMISLILELTSATPVHKKARFAYEHADAMLAARKTR